MDWNAIGAIAELVGSTAVVITIVYLTLQISQSNKSARSVSANQSRAGVTEVLSGISGDTEAVKTYTKGMVSPDELELYERVRFDLIIFQQLRAVEIIFFEHREGLVLEEVWLGQWRGAFSILKTRGGRASWARQKNYLAVSFAQWVDSQFEKI